MDDVYTPRPAYAALAAMPKRSVSGRAIWVRAESGSVEILSPDVVIRLGDVDTFHPHWARIYGGQGPCRHWKGEFYVERSEQGRWELTMEIMQVEEQGNLVTINGQPLEPMAIPLRRKLDFASSWAISSLDVPPGVLRPGLNVIEVAVSPRWPIYQDAHARFESLQFRKVHLVQMSSS